MLSAGSRLLQIEKALHRHVIGQSEAVKAVSRVIRRAGIGFRNSDGPIGSFLFASTGPIGVGRTLLAESLAIECFGAKDAMMSLNMNNYNRVFSYVDLIEALRYCRPHSVVLLEEIQVVASKYKVLGVMHEALRYGKITEVNTGLTVDLKNTIIIMTSTLGNIWNNWDAENADTSLIKVVPLLSEWIDEVIIFKELGTSELRDIVEIMVKEFSETLRAQENVKIAVTERLKKKLVEESLEQSKRFGAVSLKRPFNNVLVHNIVVGILNGRLKEGAVTVDIDPSGNVVFC